MNQTIQEAAEAIFQEQISGYPESNRGDMMYGFDYGFQAGTAAAAAALKWIPVTVSLPEPMRNCLFIVDSQFDHDNGRILGGWYTGGDFVTPGVTWKASHWCAIPEFLLNFQP